MDGDIDSPHGERATPTRELLTAVWATYELDGGPLAIAGPGGPGDEGIRDLDGSSSLNLLAEQAGCPQDAGSHRLPGRRCRMCGGRFV